MENMINTELDMDIEDIETIEDVEDVEEVAEVEEVADSDDDFDQDESDDDHEDVDLSDITPSVCHQQGRSVGKAGVMSIVHSKNGMRVALSQELMERLHHPKTVQIGYGEDRIAVSAYLGDQFTSYSMRESGTKSIIYRSELVKQITDRYDLDFSNRTSITFSDVTYKGQGKNTVAFIHVKE
ncbi:hypothetical protein T458_06045 [Brevibacillus panacihumi W25]|uniref:Uncharacterized protein n=1 Tax=Brevibacillus panacihumi W25 TaxID=1408254 RepID=V6MBJ3_9BACL|nr:MULTISPECIES: hypothetical protein [Brevibacillus]EJL46611.1 hypothetical protein PMI08_01106 [Brevibacillus sp. CF112]EST55250.1 hypothetical protein T458_08050 [Brevibacillus panacihumi W25]EST55647.1 hypothetical protein T458_06045 [Brevibacillus panacihumi W25]MCC0566907.1 hypothetical protein [Brevibacillus borstelensis]MCM3472341.1 hypothetical protein [Brevibacillus borstelensis]